MPKRLIQSPLIWALALFGALAGANYFIKKIGDATSLPSPGLLTLPESNHDAGWLIKPFLAPSGESGIALDGGEIPVLTHHTPELRFGTQDPMPVQLALLVDWHSAESRGFIARLFAAYESKTHETPPPARVIVLPVVTSTESRAVHEMLVRVHAMTSSPETFPSLILQICQQSAPPDMAAIRDFIRSRDPDLLQRIDEAGYVVDVSVAEVFKFADAQRLRNRDLLALEDSPQCVSMRLALTDARNPQDWISFLASSYSDQKSHFASPEGRIHITPEFGCRCNRKTHVHKPWKAEILKQFPALHSTADAQFKLPDAAGDISSSGLAKGPQIRFHPQTHRISADSVEGFLIHEFEFENTGDEILMIRSIQTGNPSFELEHWDRSIPPGGRGVFVVRFPNAALAVAAAALEGHWIWVDSNSAGIDDAVLGSKVVIRLR